MRDKQTAEPYQLLGEELRALRVGARESLSDTSSAVEIEVKQLATYELGRHRPSEEVLLLLISHFNPQDSDAMKLWKLAGYSIKSEEIESMLPTDDDPVPFTDLLEVSGNRHGFTLEFKQAGMGNSPRSIAKLGMSREHAESVIRALMIALAKTQDNNRLRLPGSDNQS